MKKRRTILFAIMLMAVGFASVTTTLILNGTLNFAVSDDFDVIFTSAKLNGVEHDEFITNDKKTISFITNELKKISDEETLTYKVANRSKNYDANVSISCESINNEYVDITLPSETRVLAGEERTGSIGIRLIKVSESDKEINLTCTINAEAIERDKLGSEIQDPFAKAGTLGVVDAENENYNHEKDWIVKNFPKENITKVIFEDKMIPHETEENLIYDVSDKKDGSVMAYLIKNEDTLSITEKLETTQAYTLYIQSETGVKGNKDSKCLFSEFTNLKTIEGLEYFDTSQVTNMLSMFYWCENLTTLDLNGFDTSQVTDMGRMFYYCRNLISLDVSGFDTSQVTNMSVMFSYCKKLTNLDLNGFDTSQVTDMSFMFDFCENLISLDLSGFDTRNVTDISRIFGDCPKLSASITIRGNNCQNYGSMFLSAATEEGAQIIVNYTNDASELVDAMIATKSYNSNIVKGNLVA